jgi:hypothetical protein
MDLLRKIDAFGWTVIGVSAPVGDVPSAPFAYTIGLSRLGVPELFVSGLPSRVAGSILNDLGRLAKGGTSLRSGRLDDVLANDVPLELRPFDESRAQEFLGQLIWFTDTFADGIMPSVMQVVWPDKNGHFPWDAALGAKDRADFERIQPLTLARLN